MLASPNHANFVYDGDFSDTPPPATAPDVNPGAAKIEQYFVQYFTKQKVVTEPTAFDGRSDYKPFQDNGIAAGGLFSGAEVAKTAEQVERTGAAPRVWRSTRATTRPATPSTTSTPRGTRRLADGGAHVLAMLAMDRHLRDTLAGGATAAREFRKGSQGGEGQGARQGPQGGARPRTAASGLAR